VQSLLKSCDAAIISTLKKPLYRFGISPNKIFDYMYSGRPVISLFSGEYDIIHQRGAGIRVNAQDAEACADAIRKIAEMSDMDREHMGSNGKRSVIEEFNYKTLALKLINGIS
jgi:glycosyltransferase involved in cell wall biosynthesis